MAYLILVILGSLCTFHLPGYAGTIPENPFLAKSHWPMTHQNPYNQGSSPYAGPSAEDFQKGKKIQRKLLPPGIITLAFDAEREGNSVIWASSMLGVHKLALIDDEVLVTDHRRIAYDLASGGLSGAYSLVDLNGSFFVPKGHKIFRFTGKQEDPKSKIESQSEILIPLGDGDSIVGLNLTWDGHLVFVSNHGLLGVVSRELELLALYPLPIDEEISNSIAVDEDGGIYVVSSRKMRRINWDGSTLSLAWESVYKYGDGSSIPGRLGLGSGTTPSLMGSGEDDKLVVITDGEKKMSIAAFWRAEIPMDAPPTRLAGEFAISFGDPDRESSVSEQSVLVNGYGAVLVSNDYGSLGKLPIPKRFKQMEVILTNLRAYAPYGMEKVQWNKDGNYFEQEWANPFISCPNGIPSYSEESNLIYCIGQRKGVWTLEAINWNTGSSAFYQKLGRAVNNNSAYAGTQIGPRSSIISGTATGLIQIKGQN